MTLPITPTPTTGVTLTGDNNYTGNYTDPFYVLGGANNGGHNDFDTGIGNEVFMFGNVTYGPAKTSVTITDTTYDGGGTLLTDSSHTYQSTATGSSNDTLHFDFTVGTGTVQTSNFLTDHGTPQDYYPDTDDSGAVNYYAESNISAWNSNYSAWLADHSGWTLSSLTTVETSAAAHDSDLHEATDSPDDIWSGDIVATHTTGGSVTADYTGAKTLLGFSVGSDHIALDGHDGVTSLTEDQFNANFTVTSTQHTSSNNVIVNDTTISLTGGNWSVDLYGVDTTAVVGDLHDWAWSNVITHA